MKGLVLKDFSLTWVFYLGVFSLFYLGFFVSFFGHVLIAFYILYYYIYLRSKDRESGFDIRVRFLPIPVYKIFLSRVVTTSIFMIFTTLVSSLVMGSNFYMELNVYKNISGNGMFWITLLKYVISDFVFLILISLHYFYVLKNKRFRRIKIWKFSLPNNYNYIVPAIFGFLIGISGNNLTEIIISVLPNVNFLTTLKFSVLLSGVAVFVIFNLGKSLYNEN